MQSLRLDGPDALVEQERLHGLVDVFEGLEFCCFERCAKIALPAAGALAGVEVAKKMLGEHVFADEYVLNDDQNRAFFAGKLTFCRNLSRRIIKLDDLKW